MYTGRKKITPAWVAIVRIVLALVFIASGLLKGVDPWGTAIKTGEYLTAFGMESLAGAATVLAIGQCALELWLGLLLLFNKLRGFSRFFTLLFMLFFTMLTLITALTDPVSDCGCFGDAIKLTNWQTFYKNVVLLPMAFFLWLHLRREAPAKSSGGGTAVAALVLALIPPVTAQWSLPWIDFLPYKVGTNIPGAMYVAPEDRGETHTTVLYRNLQSGMTEEFELSDTVWQDTACYEFVDSRTVEISKGKEPAITNFVLFNDTDDSTDSILAEEEVFLLVADRLDAFTERDTRRFARITQWTRTNRIRTILLTTSPLNEAAPLRQKLGPAVAFYNIDGTTLKTLIRAHKGLVILEKGTILTKKNLRQTPRFDRSEVRTGLDFVLGRMNAGREKIFVILYLLSIVALGTIAGKRCKN
jgi:uncharacterized membrane protein YphA (DoxX/SURF4 family)